MSTPLIVYVGNKTIYALKSQIITKGWTWPSQSGTQCRVIICICV